MCICMHICIKIYFIFVLYLQEYGVKMSGKISPLLYIVQAVSYFHHMQIIQYKRLAKIIFLLQQIAIRLESIRIIAFSADDLRTIRIIVYFTLSLTLKVTNMTTCRFL